MLESAYPWIKDSVILKTNEIKKIDVNTTAGITPITKIFFGTIFLAYNSKSETGIQKANAIDRLIPTPSKYSCLKLLELSVKYLNK